MNHDLLVFDLDSTLVDSQRDLLPQICQGSVGTVALFESDGDWNLEHIESSAEIAGDAARLSGTKTLVCDAAVADFVLVSVSPGRSAGARDCEGNRSSARAQDAGDRHR